MAKLPWYYPISGIVWGQKDPYADGWEAAKDKLAESENPFPPGCLAWYMWHEGWMIFNHGYPPEPFHFKSSKDPCNPVGMSGQTYTRFHNSSRRMTGTTEIYRDDETYSDWNY